MVVPVEVVAEPQASVFYAVKAARIVRLVLGRFELTFTERVVVADSGAAVAADDTQIRHQIQEALCDHGRATILMQGDGGIIQLIARQRLLYELLGQLAVLFVGDHPGHYISAVQVHDHIQPPMDTHRSGI